jgi:hypothetical protein
MRPFTRAILVIVLSASIGALASWNPGQSSSSKQNPPSAKARDNALDPATISGGAYRNFRLGLSCKIPPGWVLRTDDMNSSDDAPSGANVNQTPANNATGRVLLAAFSRPPEARGEEVNSSIVIAAEPISTYPGLKDSAQYFGPLTEVAKAQGFTVDEEPYETAIGSKTLVRSDFHKDVGTRVMRQSTLAMLARGYAISFTFIAGTEDELEELIDGLNFSSGRPVKK